MKTRVFVFLLSLLLLLPLASCAGERYDALYVTDADNGLTYSVRGSGTRARQITVKRGEELLFAEKIKVDKKVGRQGGSYGFEVIDLNFDGLLDMMIVDQVAGEQKRYLCWLANADGTYTKSEELSGLCNLQADTKLEAIRSFTHTFTREKAYQDVAAATISTDTATQYVWVDGVLTPNVRVSITYYSETARYCYSVSYYDKEAKAFSDADDKWLTPEEYREYDMSFLYYFR